jgi:hypothetical protein
MDWDVATIIEALIELYPLQAEHKNLDFGSRWQQVIDRARRTKWIRCNGTRFRSGIVGQQR